MRSQWHLSEKDFFSNLVSEKKEFLSRSVKRFSKKGEFIFFENEPADSCFYLAEGAIKISRITLMGKEPIIFVRKTGELFGLAEIVGGEKRKCNAQAISPCMFYEIKKDDFEELLTRYQSFARRVIEVLGRRLRYLGEQVENLMVCDVATRLLKLFVYLSYPKLIDLDSSPEPILVPVDLTQEQIAACTGSCQQTVSETLKLLQDEGLIRVSKKQIAILKPFEIMERILQ